MNIILFIRDISPDSSFHYSRKQGGDLIFQYNRIRQRHEAVIPLEKWRADDFFEARILLDGNLVVPIFFDIEDSAPCVAEVPAAPPVDTPPAQDDMPEKAAEPEEATSITPEAPPVKRAGKRRSALTPEQMEAAQKAFAAEAPQPEAAPAPSFIPN